jgi:hypothetical protein
MKTLLSLAISTCASVTAFAQQPSPSPSPATVTRVVYRHRLPKRSPTPPAAAATTATPQPAADFFVGEARVNVTKDETVVRLAMAQHGSVLIELPANDGPRYIIPGDPEMATVDEKALERNKRAIVVRPGSLFVPPLPNHKARMPAATVTAQMRSGLVVTFLFYPVEDLAQNVHRCVLSYNRDEVVARRRAAGLPVNLDNNSSSSERRDSTGQSTAPTSISVEDNGDSKPADSEAAKSKESKPETRPPTVGDVKETVESAATSSAPVSTLDKKVAEQNERITTLTREALAVAVKKPKQFKHWTKPAHGLALSVIPQVDPKNQFQIVIIGIKNLNPESMKLVSGSPDLLVELLDEQNKPINLESIKKLHTEVSEGAESVASGKTVYYAIAYVAPVLGARQQVKVVVSQTNAADEPASIALGNVGR